MTARAKTRDTPLTPDVRRKDEVVAAAIRVITRLGIPRASMRAIAREMGLTTGVITHYFADKNELLHEALQSFFDPWLAVIDDRPRGADPWQELERLFMPGINDVVMDFGRKRLWLGMLLHMDDQAQLGAIYRDKYGRIRERAYELIRECQARGSIRADLDPVEEGNRLFAVFDGLAIGMLGEPKRFSGDLLRRIMSSQLEALRAPAK